MSSVVSLLQAANLTPARPCTQVGPPYMVPGGVGALSMLSPSHMARHGARPEAVSVGTIVLSDFTLESLPS